MQVSMSRRANAWDNAAMESFFKTLKVERIYQECYETRKQARLDIVDWIERFYNRQRHYSSIGYRTTVGVKNMLKTALLLYVKPRQDRFMAGMKSNHIWLIHLG